MVQTNKWTRCKTRWTTCALSWNATRPSSLATALRLGSKLQIVLGQIALLVRHRVFEGHLYVLKDIFTQPRFEGVVAFGVSNLAKWY